MPRRIDRFFFGEQPQQRAIAASDVENAGLRLNHIRDKKQIDAGRNRAGSLWLR